MKKILTAFFLLLPLLSKAQGWGWARSVDAFESEVYSTCADKDDYLYVTGSLFGGTGTFGSYTLTGSSFLVKYNASGDVIWAINTVCRRLSMITTVTCDNFGNEYVFGYYSDSISFGGHGLALPGTDLYYAFMSKINNMGEVIWIKSIGNTCTYGFQNPTSLIKTDETGNIYIASSFSKNATIESTLVTNSAADSSTDILVAKFDSSGSLLWAKGYGGLGWEEPTAIGVTHSNKIYVCGRFKNDTFNIGRTRFTDNSVYSSSFIAFLNTDGSPIWAKEIDSSRMEGLTTDKDDNLYIVGVYYAAPVFGSTTLPKTPIGSIYGLVAKYDTTGASKWAKPLQGNWVLPWNATIDKCDNIWIESEMGTGHMTTNDTIDGHILEPPIQNNQPNFIACWSNSGSFVTAVAIPSGSVDDPNGITADSKGNIYVAADIEGIDTLVLGPDTVIQTHENMFFAKYVTGLSCSEGGTYITPVAVTSATSIYPNPSNNEIAILSQEQIGHLEIINTLGQVVYKGYFEQQKIRINISDLSPGVYSIKMNGVLAKEFVKE